MKKKLFAMVLAAAMSLSLGAITAHGYADDKDIVNDEAVAVMSAVGVLAGTEDGTNFAPKDELDRASAAKIITYLAVGPTAADSMKTSDAPFDDVPASHWAAGFIAYCKTSGIIAGDGSGKFNPSDKVKTNEFAKMLLTVLGYDANIEGMTGAQWSVNTSKLASFNSLYDDITKGVGDNLVREEAAQLAFNTLLADTYEYESKGTQIDLGSGSVNIGATPARTVSNNKHDYETPIGNGAGDGKMQLVEKLYGEKFKKLSNGVHDDFGRPGYKYTYDSKTVWKGSEDSLLTYNKKRAGKESNVSIDLKNAGINVTVSGKVYTLKDIDDKPVSAQLFLNGEKEGLPTYDLGELLALSNAPGKETEFFAEKGNITTVAVTEYTVGTVDSVSELKDSSGNAYTQYIINVGDGDEDKDNGYIPAKAKTMKDGPTMKAYADSSKKDNDTILHGEVKKGNVITYVKVHDQDNDKNVWHVYPTTVVKGKQSGYSSADGESTINDKTYKWGTGVIGFNAAEVQNNSDDERNFYIDKNGYLVKCDEAADSSDYVYVTEIDKNTKKSATATLVFPDGSKKEDVKITSLKLKGNKANQLEESDFDDDAGWDGFYTYSKSGEDYKLTSLDNGETVANKDTDNGFSRGNSAYNETTIIEKKKSTLANGLATIGSNTKVIVFNGDTCTVYSGGRSNMPTITRKAKSSATAQVYCVMEKDGQKVGSEAKLVYIEAKTSDWDIEDSSTKEYFYIHTTDAPSSTRVNGDDFYTYTVASDGGTKKITFNGNVKDTMKEEANPMYRITRTDKDGNITGVSAVVEGKNVIVLTGSATSQIEGITSNGISFGQNKVGTDGVSSVGVTDQTVVTRIQGKEVNGGIGGGNLSSVKSYAEKDEKGNNKIEALYVFCNSNGDAEKVYVVLAKS